MKFAVGSLVKARGREWVVLPESDEEMLLLRPLGGTNEEVAGVYLPLEPDVVQAQFELPDPTRWGDERSCRLLRDAVRLGFRSSTGPFRSFGSIGVEPRPYQLVPLLLALRQDPVRLLIADDVGIGKTVEAGLVACELLDRREVERLAILCPPHLAEQWQEEMREKFHLDAVLVLSSTVAQLERACNQDESIFDHYKHLIISLDFIKSDRRRETFLRKCPDLVIVDEAHTCTYAGEGRNARHQRYQLIKQLAEQPSRHLILVTATPHSGNEQAFRSLLRFLNEAFQELPEDLSGRQNERWRQRVAAHFVQRRRADLQSYLQEDTPFPARDDEELSYLLTTEYRELVDGVLSYARETVRDTRGGRNRQRVRWWGVLSLLSALASSPAAAAYSLRNRSQVADAQSAEEANQLGSQLLFDQGDNDLSESSDQDLGSDVFDEEADEQVRAGLRTRLEAFANAAEALRGAKDAKLQQAIKQIGNQVKQGYRPIVFCRFISTAEYVAQELRKALPRVEVAAVTGLLPPVEREERIFQLAEAEARVLVCTDCLSEGMNLQDYFDAVFHYDLSWNPTRHEQREGRVDRYGQQSPRVRVVTYYGKNNLIDELVLRVLIRKHNKIRNTLGISVPVPVDTDQVMTTLFEEVLASGRESVAEEEANQMQLPGFDDVVTTRQEELFRQWDASTEREQRSRTLFAQHSVKTEEVERELREARETIGYARDVASFTRESLRTYGAFVNDLPDGTVVFDLSEAPMAVRDALDVFRFAPKGKLHASFSRVNGDGVEYLTRTHPLVEGLAAYVMDTALDSEENPRYRPIAHRSGLIRTSAVQTRTTLLLLRLRFHIHTPGRTGQEIQPLLAEESRLFAFRGSPQEAEWFDDEQEMARLLTAHSQANTPRAQIQHFLGQIITAYPTHLLPRLEEMLRERAEVLHEAHRRVRRTASVTVRGVRVEPQLPPDVLGIYVYLPYDERG